jgi:hypothetical protein
MVLTAEQKNKLFIFVIVILLVYICIVYYYDNITMNDSLYGYWKADNDYLQENNLVYYSIFVTPKISNGYIRGYLIAKNETGFLYNGTINLKITMKYKLGNDIYAYAKLNPVYTNDNPINSEFTIPNEIKLKWSVLGEILEITNDDDTFFKGFKDIEASLVSKEDWHAFNFQEEDFEDSSPKNMSQSQHDLE